MKTIRLFLLALAGVLPLAGFAQTPSVPAASPDAAPVSSEVAAPSAAVQVKTAIDLLRSDIQHEKAVVIAEHLPLTAEETAEFWPLYNEYHAAQSQLLDERLAILKDYVATYDTMTNEQATALADKVFAWEGKRTELKRTWFKKFTEVVPAKKAAQFFQIENQINAALDLLLMDALPLIK